VETAVEAGLRGEWDPIQLIQAIQHDRVSLTRNYCDFEDLHNLLAVSGGKHPGIIVIRRDDDPRRNMSVRDIARAIGKVEAARLELVNQYLILNPWQ
jgi:hypothetical protein